MSNRGHRAEALRGMHYKVQCACAQVYPSVSEGGGEGCDLCLGVLQKGAKGRDGQHLLGQRISVSRYVAVYSHRATVVSKSLHRCCCDSPAAERARKSIVGKVLISRGDIHWGKGIHTLWKQPLWKKNVISSWLASPLPFAGERNYTHEHLHGAEPGGTLHLMRILFILSGATNLSSEHFVLIKN